MTSFFRKFRYDGEQIMLQGRFVPNMYQAWHFLDALRIGQVPDHLFNIIQVQAIRHLQEGL